MVEETIIPELTKEQRILEQRAHVLARQMTEDMLTGEFLYLLTFSLGKERVGVEIVFVQKVQPLKKQMWSPVPCTPDFIVGAVNIRGRIYSIMHIGRFLGLKPSPLSDAAHVLLVQGGGKGGPEEMELCILADDMPQEEKVPLTSIQPVSTGISSQTQAYIRGVTNDMLLILDLERLLSDPGIIVNEME